MMYISDNDIKKFLATHDYDVRKSRDARFMDQKCIPDVLCAVAECVLEYTGEDTSKEFTKNDIWHSAYSSELVTDSFSKPDPEAAEASSEYDKFFAQPLKLLAYAEVLEERKEKGKNVYKIRRRDILEYLSAREKNALVFLNLYLTKVMEDSGCIGWFEDFFRSQDKNSFNALKDYLREWYLEYTRVRNRYEPSRIFNKIINILAFCRKKRGTERGEISKYSITIGDIRYNRVNWRDTNKPKNVSRQEYEKAIAGEIAQAPGYYERAVQKAKSFVRNLEEYSEVHRYPAYKATDAHHIFMKSDYPELADMPENIIALTGTEHYSYAHPNRNTNRVDSNYQMVCLLCKLDSIERNFQNGASDYSLSDFAKVLNVGLETSEFNEQMGYEGIKANILKYLRPENHNQPSKTSNEP